jgi:hypothetical protein
MLSNIAAGAGVATCRAPSSASPLHSLDLLEQQFAPIELTTDLSLEMLRQGTAVARLELVEPSPTVATQRLVAGYALREQQSFDPVDMQARSSTGR